MSKFKLLFLILLIVGCETSNKTSLIKEEHNHHQLHFWQQKTVVNATLEADFGALKNSDQYIPAFLTLHDYSLDKIPITVKVSGNTSAYECEFPKLKIKFKENIADSISALQGIKAVYLGTHCGDASKGEYTDSFRWANEAAAVREETIYKIAKALNIKTLETRVGRMTYVDTVNAKSFTRSMFFVQDGEELAASLDGRLLAQAGGGESEESEAKDTSGMDKLLITKIYLLEAIIGNSDWWIPLESGPRNYTSVGEQAPPVQPLYPPGFWNIMVIETKEGKRIPIPFDFDIAQSVTGFTPKYMDSVTYIYKTPFEFAPEFKTGYEKLSHFHKYEMFLALQNVRRLFSDQVLAEMFLEFQKSNAQESIKTLLLESLGSNRGEIKRDADGYDFLMQRIRAMFNLVKNEQLLKVNLISKTNIFAYKDPKKKQRCYIEIPLGTPYQVLPAPKPENNMVAVALMDVRSFLPDCWNEVVWIESKNLN